jgi:hypothetical protein
VLIWVVDGVRLELVARVQLVQRVGVACSQLAVVTGAARVGLAVLVVVVRRWVPEGQGVGRHVLLTASSGIFRARKVTGCRLVS